MCTVFSKYNTRLSKCKSFLKLKNNSVKVNGADAIFQTLDFLFSHGSKVQQHKADFLDRLFEIFHEHKRREFELANKVQRMSNDKLKSRCFSSWKSKASTEQTSVQKVTQFYLQNLKIKAFFILLRYSRKMKEIRSQEQEDALKMQQFTQHVFFKRWRRAYTHKMNQLENRRCFKVKFSDYCRCKK